MGIAPIVMLSGERVQGWAGARSANTKVLHHSTNSFFECLFVAPNSKEATPGKGVASGMNYFWLIARFSGAALGVAASVAGASIGSILTVVKIRFSRLNTCWRSTCGMSASAARVV